MADPNAAIRPDLVPRDFRPDQEAVDTRWCGNITYLPVSGAKPLYLATVIDIASRQPAGWAIADHMRTELVIDALAAAERTRGSLAGAVMHTGHGSQGGFNWSSQHLVVVEVRGGLSSAGSGAGGASEAEVSGASKYGTVNRSALFRSRW
ncbi:DDE-type integrase/transposase/recombinase [Streptomyces sp. NPDC051577]|uniref:DDE-type integrase/transposase/recombinase n=1 Tax=Streptomyces sp. NPDC051577 TaxID=3155166 RepID=UPI00343372DB